MHIRFQKWQGEKILNKKLASKGLKILISLFFIVYLVVLVNVIILKDGTALVMAKHRTQISFSQKINQINIVPLVNTIIPYLKGGPSIRISIENLLGNIFAFSPLGFFLPLLLKQCTRLKNTLLVSFVISLLIEIVQLIFSIGACDIDDIILNVFGSLLGFGVYYLFRNLFIRKFDVIS